MAAVVIILGAGLALLSYPSQAVGELSFTVTSPADATDAAIGDGQCAAADGSCTLRAAVMEAAANVGGTTVITLPAGTFALAIPPTGVDDDSASGDLNIHGRVTVTGAGRKQTVIDAAGLDRVFQVELDGDFTLHEVRLTNGDTSSHPPGADHGGAIRNLGILDVQDTDIIGNKVPAGALGGGIGVSGGPAVATRLSKVTLYKNQAHGGGGLADGSVGTTTITDTFVATNGATRGAGLYFYGGGNGVVTSSTLFDNWAVKGGDGSPEDGMGGAVLVDGGNAMALTNVTVTRNHSQAGGAGYAAVGAAGSHTLVHGTFAGNEADTGGGNLHADAVPFTVKNTILGASTPANSAATVVSQGNNIDSGNTCGLTGAGDLVATDPQLVALDENSGPVPTMALPGSSPAVNAASADCGGTTADARGAPRVAGACDMGAFERISGSALTLTTTSPTVLVGEPVTFTATFKVARFGFGRAEGEVTFHDGAVTLASVTLADSKAVFTTSSLPVGAHSITVAFAGNADVDPATSAAVEQAVVVPPPVVTAVDDSGVSVGTAPVTIKVLTNDAGVAGVPVLVGTSPPAHGKSVVNDDSTVTYTPADDFYGTDEFTYTVLPTAPLAVPRKATVRVEVKPMEVSAVSHDGRPVNVALTSVDPNLTTLPAGTVVGLQVQVPPAHGTVAVNGATIIYTPNAGFTGDDVLRYKAVAVNVSQASAAAVPAAGTRLSAGVLTFTVEQVAPVPTTLAPRPTTTLPPARPTTTTTRQAGTPTATTRTTRLLGGAELITAVVRSASPTTSPSVRTATTVAPVTTAVTVAPTTTTTLAVVTRPGALDASSVSGPMGLEVRAPAIGEATSPGMMVAVSGSSIDPLGCAAVYVFFDLDRLGRVATQLDGRFRGTFAIPGDAVPGRHDIVAACAGDGVARRTVAQVDVVDAGLHRSAFVTSTHSPRQVSRESDELLVSALIAILTMAILAFVAKLYNATFGEHDRSMAGWFGVTHHVDDDPPRHRVLAMGAFFVVAAGAYAFIDPGLDWNLSSLAAATGMLLALVVITLGFVMPVRFCVHMWEGERGVVRVLPGTLIAVVACVAFSRAMHLQPGFAYGLIAGVTVRSRLRSSERGSVAFTSAVTVLAISLVAWLLWLPMASGAANHHPSFVLLAYETMLVATFTGGLSSVLVTLVPVRFLDGEEILRWNRAAWAELFGVSLFAFVHIVLRPGNGYVNHASPQPVVTGLALLGAFAVCAVAFRLYAFLAVDAAPMGSVSTARTSS